VIASRRDHQSFATFSLAAVVVVGICVGITRTAVFADNPDVGYFGVTFDLCITVPLLYWLLVVRPGRAGVITLFPVFILSIILARLIVPLAHRAFLADLMLLQIPVELALVGVVTRRAFEVRKRSVFGDDIVDNIALASSAMFGTSRAARFVASEIAASYLGLFGWRLPEPDNRGVASTTFHRRAGWGSIVICLIVVIAAEAIAVHLFVQRWSAGVAWFVTGLDLGGAIWLIGDYQAFRLRRLVVTNDAIELKFGFRWTATIPFALIDAIEPLSAQEDERLRRTRHYLRCSILEEPQHIIRLQQPVRVTGMAGFTREVSAIGLRVDDENVIEAIRHRRDDFIHA
jgi:hypothetical protein